MMEQEFPPDWAIEEAIKRSGVGATDGVTLAMIKCNPTFVWVVMTLTAARLIAQHEEPPLDPLIAEAREIANSFADGDETLEIALEALKRGIEIGKEQARGEG